MQKYISHCLIYRTEGVSDIVLSYQGRVLIKIENQPLS